MFIYNFISPSQSGSISLDGSIIIVIALIFIVAYIYMNRNNLKIDETQSETINDNNTMLNNFNEEKVSSDERKSNVTSIKDDSNKTSLQEDSEEFIEEKENVKLYN